MNQTHDDCNYPEQSEDCLVDAHIERCREYSKRKRALLESFPNISPAEYEQQVKRIAAEVGI